MRIDAQGHTLRVRVHGEGRRQLVLVHGWMMAGAVFEPILAPLGRHARLAVPDLRGAGESSPADRYRLEDYAADLVAVLETTGPAAVVAHSMGGAVAQLVAIERPELVEALVLLNPVPASGLPLPDEAMALFESSAGDRDKQATILAMACMALSDADRDRLLDVAATVDGDSIRQSLRAWTAGGFADRLGQIRAETHVVATSDPFLPPAFLTETVVEPIAGARLHVLDGPGHYPMVEAPDRSAELLVSLLRLAS